MTNNSSLEIIKCLQSAGFSAVYVGGCVRDWLMGNTPHDWDIATSATPDEVESLFSHTIAVGKSFGVIVVITDGGEYEVATFRMDGAYADGRRPDSVSYCVPEEDARRRDFTVNALMFDPVSGKLYDFVAGENDLHDKIIRTVGSARERFLEDHLRLLRAVRFAARLGFTIEEQTFAAVREMAALATLVSAERIGQELMKMLTGKSPEIAIGLLEKGNLLLHLLPEVARMRGMPQPAEFHPEGDVMEHTLIMLRMLGAEKFDNQTEHEILAWAVLFHDIGKPLTLELSGRIRFNRHDRIGADLAACILRHLKRPNKIIEAVEELIARHMHMGNLVKMRTAKLRRFLRGPLFPLHLKLHYYDCSSSHNMLDNFNFGSQAYEEEMSKGPEILPLLNGRDLIDLGYHPGPAFSKMLDNLLDAQLEGRINSKFEALNWVKNHYRT